MRTEVETLRRVRQTFSSKVDGRRLTWRYGSSSTQVAEINKPQRSTSDRMYYLVTLTKDLDLHPKCDHLAHRSFCSSSLSRNSVLAGISGKILGT